MAVIALQLAPDATTALEEIRSTSREGPVLVLKKSPICSISSRAEQQLSRFLSNLPEDRTVRIAILDVLDQKDLARGLTEALGIPHASPQALLFAEGDLRWHASHGNLTTTAFAEQLAALGS